MSGTGAKLYYVTFGGLAVLTVITVAIARVDLGYTPNIVAALAVASAKATLVAMFFMHLKSDGRHNPIFYAAALLPLALFVILVFASSVDLSVLTGPMTPPPQDALPAAH